MYSIFTKINLLRDSPIKSAVHGFSWKKSRLKQVTYLMFVTCKVQHKDEWRYRFRMLYSHGEHWFLLVADLLQTYLARLPVFILLFEQNYSSLEMEVYGTPNLNWELSGAQVLL